MSQNKTEQFPLKIEAENAMPIGRKNGIIMPTKMNKQMPGLEEAKIGTVQFGIEQVFVVDQTLVDEGNWQMAKKIASERSQKGRNEAFTLFNVDTVVNLFHQWRQNMPRVKPFFAVKCNNDPVLVATLAKMGAGFDCASREEIDLILDNGFGQPEDVIYANTCKTPEFICHAQQRGINRFTFDCVEELAKMKKVHPNAEMVLRIDVTDKSAKRPLDIKFGCHPLNDAPRLLSIAKEMEMKIVGISFHVGSGCQNPFVYREAIGMAQKLFKLGEELGHRMRVLDLGGGFPGCEEEKQFFEEVSKVICNALDEFFPAEYLTASSPQRKISTDSGFGFDEEDEEEMEKNNQSNEEDQPKLEIIAEPGRYFASSPSSVCTMVIGATRVNVQKLTKSVEDGQNNKNDDAFMYYLDDGVYGSFSCLSSRLFTKVPNGKPIFPRNEDEEFPSVVWGPTCDSRDQVEQLCPKPRLQPGDWLFYSDMGAYTRVTSTNFNGFTRPKDVYYVVGKQIWDFLNCADRIRG